MKVAFLFPGQGSQYPGMGKDFFDHFGVAREIFEEADRLLGFSLSELMFNGPEEKLKKTLYSQLAIFVMSLAVLRVVEEKFPNLRPIVCAGLSLGEYTALCASKRLSFEKGLFLVKERAALMSEACEQTAGTMAAVLGLEENKVDEIVKELSSSNVWVANYNCPGQIVISGSPEGVALASQKLQEKGAKRVLPLAVHGAFHSGLMKGAEKALTSQIQATSFHESGVDLVMNVPGDYVYSLADLKQFLIRQLTESVRWEAGIRKMQQKGIHCFLELGSGKTLTGMNRKIGVPEALAIEKVEDLLAFEKKLGGS
jgi:[acyl-carrier-protein] S-malonyltransferase